MTRGTSATNTVHHNSNVEPTTVAEQAEHELGAPDTPTPESCLLAPHETVVMQTARTELENPATRDAFTACILLTRQVSGRTLQKRSPTVSRSSVSARTLCQSQHLVPPSGQPCPIQSPRVYVGLTQKDGSVLTITANVIPTITGPVHCAVLPNLEQVCQHLCLADNMPNQGEVTNIDPLIGNNYYHDIISADRLSVGPSLHLLSSTLGWIVSGCAPSTTNANCSLLTVSMTSVLSTHTNGSQLATAKPHTSLVAGKPIQLPLALETPNILMLILTISPSQTRTSRSQTSNTLFNTPVVSLVRLANGSIMRRPVTLLYHLEVTTSTPVQHEPPPPAISQPSRHQPSRFAKDAVFARMLQASESD